MRWRTSVSSHVGVVLKQPLVAKAVAAAVLQLPQAHGHGPAQAMDVVAWRMASTCGRPALSLVRATPRPAATSRKRLTASTRSGFLGAMRPTAGGPRAKAPTDEDDNEIR